MECLITPKGLVHPIMKTRYLLTSMLFQNHKKFVPIHQMKIFLIKSEFH